MVGHVLVSTPVPQGVDAPRGFTEQSNEMEGYVDKDGDFITYMTDDTGNSSFYYYDPDLGEFFKYESVERTAENVYRSLFYLFITVSVLQSIFIVAMTYAIRKIFNNRANPRPKRV